MVEIKDNEEDDGTSHAYFWDPKHGYLTGRGLFREDRKLSIELVRTEGKEGDGVESVAQLRLKNDHYRAKINDLSQQVKSLEVICNRQERSLRTLKFVEEMTSVGGINQKNVEVPFSAVSISNTQRQQRPQCHVAKVKPHDHAEEIQLRRPYDPQNHQPYQPDFVTMDGYGSPPNVVSMPFGGHDPYHPIMYPHHPMYEHPIRHPYSNDCSSHTNYRDHHYSSMPGFGLEPHVMRPPQRVDGPYNAPAHRQPSMLGEKIYSTEK